MNTSFLNSFFAITQSKNNEINYSLQKINQKYNLVFPSDYKEILLQNIDIQLKKGKNTFFSVKKQSNSYGSFSREYSLDCFINLENMEEYVDNFKNYYEIDYEVVFLDFFFPFFATANNGFLCIGNNELNMNKIYFLDIGDYDGEDLNTLFVSDNFEGIEKYLRIEDIE